MFAMGKRELEMFDSRILVSNFLEPFHTFPYLPKVFRWMGLDNKRIRHTMSVRLKIDSLKVFLSLLPFVASKQNRTLEQLS